VADESETSPVSFDVHVARLPRNGMPVVFEADAHQRAELARAHGLVSVEAFRVELLVSPWRRHGVKVEGRLTATITQACIVTLEPINAAIDEAVSATYLPEDSKLGREGFGLGGEILIDVDGPDSPEIFTGDRIDVGALAEEFFGLAIDPYPRKPGAALASPDPGGEPGGSDEMRSKLAALFPKT
jgi:hypothetical protein